MKSGFGLVRTLPERARQRTPMEIWGDGENVRDLVYIDDFVEAMLPIVNQTQHCGTYNLCSGEGYSINEVKVVVESVCGVSLSWTD